MATTPSLKRTGFQSDPPAVPTSPKERLAGVQLRETFPRTTPRLRCFGFSSGWFIPTLTGDPCEPAAGVSSVPGTVTPNRIDADRLTSGAVESVEVPFASISRDVTFRVWTWDVLIRPIYADGTPGDQILVEADGGVAFDGQYRGFTHQSAVVGRDGTMQYVCKWRE